MYTVQSLYDITITPYIIWRYSTGSFSLVKFNHAFDTTYLCKGVYSVGIRYTQWLKYSIQLHTHIIYIPTTPKILKDNILHIIRVVNSLLCDLNSKRYLLFPVFQHCQIHINTQGWQFGKRFISECHNLIGQNLGHLKTKYAIWQREKKGRQNEMEETYIMWTLMKSLRNATLAHRFGH